MKAVFYLYGKNLKNRLRIAFRKPVTYIFLIVILFYLFIVPASLKMVVEQFSIDTPGGMAAVLAALALWVLPANIIAYARRKGLVYRNCDVHFMFPSPVSPKAVLLYAHLRTLAMQLLMNLFAVVYGGILFHVEPWRLAAYFIFSVVAENLFEGSLMLLLYGSERLDEKRRGLVVKAAYGVAGCFVLIGLFYCVSEGLSWGSVAKFLHSGAVQLVPLAGWYIAVIHLLFMEATVYSVAGTVLYCLAFVLVLAAAWRMRCTGDFYEDAIKFSEDYEEVLASRRQGNTDKRLGKKKHFKKAEVSWKGGGARALFYRQLLEYKKTRFFIFDINTLTAILGGAGIVWFYVREGGFGEFTPYVIPAVSAYLIFIFTSMNGKWAKELGSPYTYMLPDNPFSKLVNATGIQLLQGVINGCLLVLPGAFAMKLSPAAAALCVAFYAGMYANKLYALAVSEIIVGSALGRAGKQLVQLFLQSVAVFMAVAGAVAGNRLGSALSAYVLMDLMLFLCTAVFMVIAALNFYKMETA